MRHGLVLSVLGALGALGALGLVAGGCTQQGDYEATWQFAAAGDAPDGCGAHGVDAVLVTGSSDAGDRTSVTALCTTGLVKSSIPTGSWHFAIYSLDVEGKAIWPIDQPDAQAPEDTSAPGIAITDGGLATFAVTLQARPACRDGIDNDGDGRVDLDDPDCAGQAEWTDESRPPPL